MPLAALGKVPFHSLLADAMNEKPETKAYCNYFLYAVADKLGIYLPPGLNADGLIHHMESTWYLIPTSDEAERRAVHQLVVAGQKGADHIPPQAHGHVAVVIPKAGHNPHIRAGKNWPYAWSSGAVLSLGEQSIGSQIWNMKSAPTVRYFTPSRAWRIHTVPQY